MNDGGIDDLHARIERLHQTYLALSTAHKQPKG